MFKNKPKISAGFVVILAVALSAYVAYYVVSMYLPRAYISTMKELCEYLVDVCSDAPEFVAAFMAQRLLFS